MIRCITTLFSQLPRLSAEEHFSLKVVNSDAEVMTKYYKRGFAYLALFLLGFFGWLARFRRIREKFGHKVP